MHIVELTYPVLLTSIADDFGVRAVILGTISSVFGWAFGISAVPAGFLTDRLGSRRVLIYTFVGTAVTAVLVGLSPNEWYLAATLTLLGLCVGLYHPAGISLIAQGIRQRGLALGYHGMAANIGQALVPVIAVGLAVALDWRAAFFFLAGLAALLALMLSATTLPVSGQAEVMPTESAVLPERDKSRRRFGHLFSPLLLIYAAFILSGVVYRGAITFLPKHLEDLVSGDIGSVFVTVALLMGAIGQFMGRTLSHRIRLERLAPVLGLLALPALIFTGLVTGAALVVLTSLFIFFYFANQPVLIGLIADYSPTVAMGRSYGITFFALFGLGGAGGVIAGYFVDRWDTGAAFLALSGFLALTVLLTSTLWLLSERRARPPAPEPAAGDG